MDGFEQSQMELSNSDMHQKSSLGNSLAVLVTQVKNLPAVQETWVRSLGQEDPLEKGMEIHYRILAWRIAWTEEPSGPRVSQRAGHC